MSAFTNRDHLVVLCHGLNGNHKELAYLERKILAISDCVILNSKRNNGNLSKLGIDICAQELVDEIRETILQHPGQLRRISLVGMSLGGLIQRAAAKLLYEPGSKTIAGLVPDKFIAIASPFIGVNSNTYIPIPRFLEKAIAFFISDTGKDLFCTDESNPLVFKMCTHEEYLQPLEAFSHRKLYAALANDFMVPLETAAFLEKDEVDALRSAFSNDRGIVVRLDRKLMTDSSQAFSSEIVPVCTLTDGIDRSENRVPLMKAKLNSLGWEKIIVNFGGLLPFAHFQICVNERYPAALASLMGVDAGKEIMDDCARELIL